MSQDTREYILQMKGIRKVFPGVIALDDMRLNVRRGSVHVLVGENGAGKSTLMKVLSGQYQVDAGEIWFDGGPLAVGSAKESLNTGIAMVHQELSPILEMTVGENIFLGREPMQKNRLLIHHGDLYSEAEQVLRRIGLSYPVRSKMKDLSVASLQLIEIAKAVSREAKLIIMDEPTSAITEKEVEILFAQVAELKRQGIAIIYITHKMDEIFRIADDITVIRDGKWIVSGPASEFTQQRIVEHMVGRTIDNFFPKENVPIGNVVLEVRNLCSEGLFRDISFQVRAGEILGIAGLVGAGRTEVARAIFGLDPITGGEIFMHGRPVRIRRPRDAVQNGIAMVSEDRKAVGLVLCRPVRENISLANLRLFAKGPWIEGRREKARVGEMVELLRIKIAGQNQEAASLSGGNQQKVVLAKWLLGELKVLILDEPTRGIDVGSKAEIHRLMCQLAGQGIAIVMISSELPEILGMSDRIVVMHEGLMRGELPRAEAASETIMHLAIS